MEIHLLATQGKLKAVSPRGEGGGALPKMLLGFVAHFSEPLPSLDQNMWFSLPYFRLSFPTLFQTWPKILYPISETRFSKDDAG